MTSPSSSSSPQYFFVDDNSTDIRYLGSWSLTTVTADNYTSVGLTAYPMYGTVHTYKAQGGLANFTFTFSGSFVEVRFAPSPSNDYIECTIDETEYLISTSNGCSSTSLDHGVHTLTLGIRPSSLNSQIFDYIRYLALPNATVTPGDPWISIGDESIRSTKLSAQTAILSPGGTLDYEFMGTSLSLYKASVFTDSHSASYGYYTLDGGEPVNVTLENNATPLTSYIYPQILIQTPSLPYGKHHFHFALDPSPESDTMPLRGTIIVQNSSVQSEPIPQTVYQFDDLYSPPTSTASTSKLGGIVGGTLAAALLAVLLVYLAILRRRRKLLLRRHFVNEEELIHPFFSGQGPPDDSTRRPMEKRSMGTLGTGLSGSCSNSAENGQELRAPRFRVHEDSGEDVIQPDQGVEIVDLPPTYEGIETRRRIVSAPPLAQEGSSAATVKHSSVILSWQNSPSTR
uniref:Uncharacterized protein n=1 Tax=Psilocybe cubensis TaxID=181762 RepID=A0A8H7Y8W9_PSICU